MTAVSRMTAAEYRALHSTKKREGRIKGAQRTLVGDLAFDSALEASRYAELMLMQRSGQISDLKCQVNIPLFGADGHQILTPKGRQMHYRADFTYREERSGLAVIEDAKGYRTEQYRMKLAILKAMGVEVREITRTKKRKRGRP